MHKNLKEGKREIKFKEHDIAFIFGDLNFRLNLNNYECRAMIKKKQYDLLKTFDQFKVEKTTNPNLVDIEEGDLNFDPTYKFDIRTNEYDTSKKKRVPSWCDRIFWKKNNNIKQIKYNSVNYLNSDHRPVYGLFKIKYERSYEDFVCNTEEVKTKSNKNIKQVTKFKGIQYN